MKMKEKSRIETKFFPPANLQSGINRIDDLLEMTSTAEEHIFRLTLKGALSVSNPPRPGN